MSKAVLCISRGRCTQAAWEPTSGEPRFTPLPVAILQYFGNENFPVVFLLSDVLKSEFRDSPKATRAQVSAFPHLRCFLEPDSGPPLLRIEPRIGQVHCKWK